MIAVELGRVASLLRRGARTALASRSSTLWAGAILVLALVLVGANYYVFASSKREVIAKEERQLHRVTETTAASVDNLLNVTRIALESIRSAHRKNLSPQELHNILGVTTESLPFLRAAAIVDQTGHLLHSSRHFPVPRVDLSSTAAVRYFLDGGTEPSFIAGPSRNLVDGQWQMLVAIPSRDAAGDLRRIFVAVLDARYIHASLLALGERDPDFITLVNEQFHLVARHPWRDDEIGTSMAAAPVLRMLAASGGDAISGIIAGAATGDQHIAVARRLKNGPFVVSASRPLGEALAFWRTTSLATAGGSAGLILLFGACWWISTHAEALRSRQASKLEAANTRLIAETERAAQLAAAKSEFLANMSHEIRTPLNGIIGYAGLALEQANPVETQQYISRVFDAGNTLRVIVDEILDFSTMEAGEVRLDPVSFSLSAMLENCLSIVRPAATVKGLALRADIASNIPDGVVGDGWRLRQVLLNLLHNAIKFTERGGVELVVRHAAAADRVEVRFAVRDTGIGISEEQRAKLFERFSQADSSATRRFGGTGLGLVISQRLVKSMGGTIAVDSAPRAGSTFSFTLSFPLTAAERAEDTAAEAPDPGHKLRILVVDDYEMNRDLAATILGHAGHEIEVASSGAVAVHMARTGRYDLILMDVHMPDMDGIEATRQIRELGHEAGNPPIVAMTASVLPAQIARYLEAGMTDCMGKPIDASRLLEGIGRWIGGRPRWSPPPPPPQSSVHDLSVWTNLIKLFGTERAQRFARNLKDKLDADPWKGGAACREALIQPAHSAVSAAGQLGFHELSAASRELETACLHDGPIEAALDSFRQARARALAELDRLLAETSVSADPPTETRCVQVEATVG